MEQEKAHDPQKKMFTGHFGSYSGKIILTEICKDDKSVYLFNIEEKIRRLITKIFTEIFIHLWKDINPQSKKAPLSSLQTESPSLIKAGEHFF